MWAASSFVEGLAAMIVIWRFTGRRTISEHSEHTAQRLVAGTFLLLIPFFLYEAIRRLIDGSDTTSSALGIAVTTSADRAHARTRPGKASTGTATGLFSHRRRGHPEPDVRPASHRRTPAARPAMSDATAVDAEARRADRSRPLSAPVPVLMHDAIVAL